MITALPVKPVILVVDDDEDMLILLQEILLDKGFNPVFSPNGVNVMEIISRISPDLVLMDIQMRGVNGGDLCAAIKHNPATAHIPVIILSGNDNIETVTASSGAEGFIKKPFNVEKFTQTFLQVLSHNHSK